MKKQERFYNGSSASYCRLACSKRIPTLQQYVEPSPTLPTVACSFKYDLGSSKMTHSSETGFRSESCGREAGREVRGIQFAGADYGRGNSGGSFPVWRSASWWGQRRQSFGASWCGNSSCLGRSLLTLHCPVGAGAAAVLAAQFSDVHLGVTHGRSVQSSTLLQKCKNTRTSFKLLQQLQLQSKEIGDIIKKILLFIQPMFIQHLLHFPDTILGTENTVVNNTSPCSGGVYILVQEDRLQTNT